MKMKYFVALLMAMLLAGCGDGVDDYIVTNPLNVNVPPTANDDSFVTLGNATMNRTAANGVLANDVTNGAAITAFDAVGSNGGTVVMNADGSFSYTPVFGFTGTETFTYTLTNANGASTGTVTATINNLAFFVDNTLAGGGNGSQATPFNNLADGVAALGTGDTLFVFRGDGTSTNLAGAFTLPAGASLIGEAVGLSVNPRIVAQEILPVGLAPTITGPITLSNGNTVSGLTIEGSASEGITSLGFTDATITNNTFRGNAQDQLNLLGGGGTILVSGNTFESVPDTINAIFFGTDSSGTFTFTGNTFTDDAATDPGNALFVGVAGSSVATVNVSNNSTTGDAVGTAFNQGLVLSCMESSNVTLSATGNNFSTLDFHGFNTDTTHSAATLSSTISGNIIDLTGSTGIESNSDGTINLTVAQNTISNIQGAGVSATADTDGSMMTAIISGNTVLGTVFGIELECNAPNVSTVKAAVRDNSVTNSLNFSVVAYGNGTESMCLDITGNTVNDSMRFEDNGLGAINVERLEAADGGPLTAVNTFSAGTVETVDNVVSQAAGFCGL